MKYSLVKGRVHKGETILTVRHHPGWLASLFGSETSDVQYIGGCTVWRELSTHRRCHTGLESLLSDYEARFKWQQSKATGD